MIDFAKITVRAGCGGRGAGSFHHIKRKSYGKADGGDGGRGGHVFIETTNDLSTLEPYRFVKNYTAKNGVMGLANFRKGADARDLVLKVPVGTELKVNSNKTNRTNSTYETYDFLTEGQRMLIARGGDGGRGNSKLRDEFGRRPRAGEPGGEGEAVEIELELKLLADVGLIGLPNAGKSTLLSVLTAAKPEIAAYPFTTLEPNLGVFESTVESRQSKQKHDLSTFDSDLRLVFADIPGLIEGASSGRGLGDQFLRHIERTGLLVHLIDVSGGLLGDQVIRSLGKKVPKNLKTQLPNNLWQNYQTVRNELKQYSTGLPKKKEIIVLTKTDLVDDAVVDGAIAVFSNHRKKAYPISATSGQGIEELVREIQKRVGSR